MSCAPNHSGHARRRAETELWKQQQRQLWTAAVTGAVTGAVNGARGASAPPQVRIGDVERESAVSALAEHYVAGRISKDELDERTDAAWAARTSGDLAPLFSDLPQLRPPAPPRPRPSRQSRDSWRMGARLSWVLAVLMVLAVTSHVPWFAVAIFVGLWWTGLFSGLRRWAHRRP